jgi:hypothetical protein
VQSQWNPGRKRDLTIACSEPGDYALVPCGSSIGAGPLMLSVGDIMRYQLPIIVFVLLACFGCSRYDARLNGTWRSNREESVAAAFKRDPRWTNATPEKVERFRDIFGHMTVTYSKNLVTSNYKGEESILKYRLIEKGKDYVVIQTTGTGFGDGLTRIRFVDQGRGIWVESGKVLGMETPEEKFDRITEPSGAADRAQPVRSETNRTSSAAGPGP